MSIIVEDRAVAACLNWENGVLAIQFDDPAYIRAEQVMIDRTGLVSVLFAQGWHHIGHLPDEADPQSLHIAHLSAAAHDLCLRAPIKTG